MFVLVCLTFIFGHVALALIVIVIVIVCFYYPSGRDALLMYMRCLDDVTYLVNCPTLLQNAGFIRRMIETCHSSIHATCRRLGFPLRC